MGAEVYLPQLPLRLRRQGASWPSVTLASRPGAPGLQPEGKEGPLRGAGVRKLGLVLFKPC